MTAPDDPTPDEATPDEPSHDEATPDEPSSDGLTREEILSRLDEVLQDEDDELPPDVAIPDEDEDRAEDPWTGIDDAAQRDLDVPLHDRDGEAPEEFWAQVEDVVAQDLDLPAVEEETEPDPWAPVPPGVLPEDSAGLARRAERGFALPLSSPRPGLLPAPRTLPWRGTADLMEPELPALLCVADPTATGSRLLVAAWCWADEATGDLLRFRVSDDGPEIEVAPRTPHEAVLESTLKILDIELLVRLHLEAVRDQRGVVLGRDVLAGRFVIDPSREDWSEDED